MFHVNGNQKQAQLDRLISDKSKQEWIHLSQTKIGFKTKKQNTQKRLLYEDQFRNQHCGMVS